MKVVLLCVTLISVTACTPQKGPVVLTPDAQRVQILTSSDACATCQYLGALRSYRGSNFVSLRKNTETVNTDIRNQAAQMGATHLVLNPSTTIHEDCKNCIELTGHAYKCE